MSSPNVDTPAPAPAPAAKSAGKGAGKGLNLGPRSRSSSSPAGLMPMQAPAVQAGPNGTAVLLIGGGLILVDVLTQSNSHSVLARIWNVPGSAADAKSAGGGAFSGAALWTLAGEGLFLVVLAVIADTVPAAKRPIFFFLFGLWVLWLVENAGRIGSGPIGKLFLAGRATNNLTGGGSASAASAASAAATGSAAGSAAANALHGVSS